MVPRFLIASSITLSLALASTTRSHAQDPGLPLPPVARGGGGAERGATRVEEVQIRSASGLLPESEGGRPGFQLLDATAFAELRRLGVQPSFAPDLAREHVVLVVTSTHASCELRGVKRLGRDVTVFVKTGSTEYADRRAFHLVAFAKRADDAVHLLDERLYDCLDRPWVASGVLRMGRSRHVIENGGVTYKFVPDVGIMTEDGLDEDMRRRLQALDGRPVALGGWIRGIEGSTVLFRVWFEVQDPTLEKASFSSPVVSGARIGAADGGLRIWRGELSHGANAYLKVVRDRGRGALLAAFADKDVALSVDAIVYRYRAERTGEALIESVRAKTRAAAGAFPAGSEVEVLDVKGEKVLVQRPKASGAEPAWIPLSALFDGDAPAVRLTIERTPAGKVLEPGQTVRVRVVLTRSAEATVKSVVVHLLADGGSTKLREIPSSPSDDMTFTLALPADARGAYVVRAEAHEDWERVIATATDSFEVAGKKPATVTTGIVGSFPGK